MNRISILSLALAMATAVSQAQLTEFTNPDYTNGVLSGQQSWNAEGGWSVADAAGSGNVNTSAENEIAVLQTPVALSSAGSKYSFILKFQFLGSIVPVGSSQFTYLFQTGLKSTSAADANIALGDANSADVTIQYFGNAGPANGGTVYRLLNNFNTLPGAANIASGLSDGDELQIDYTLTLGTSAANSTYTARLQNLTDSTDTGTGTVTGIPASVFDSLTNGGAFFFFQSAAFAANASGITNAQVDSFNLPLSATPLVWNGDLSDDWDTTTQNWRSNGVPATYTDGANVVFDDTASQGIVDLNNLVSPTSVTFSNNTLAYNLDSSFSYGAIVGAAIVNKRGSGVVTIGNDLYSTYTGPTRIQAGKLVEETGSGYSIGSAYTVEGGATNGVKVTAASTSYTVGSLTCNAGSVLEFDFGSVAHDGFTAPLNTDNSGATGNLTINGATGVRIVGGTSWIPGATYPLVQYAGNISGFASLSLVQLPAGVYGVLTLDTSAKVVSLLITGAPTIWTGNVNSTWDIANTTNWKAPSGSPKTYTDGDNVLLDDSSAVGTVNISVNVAPVGVTVSNGATAYTLNGPAGITNLALGLTKQGPGTLTVNATNSYGGATVIKEGTVLMGGANLLTGQVQVNGGTWNINGNDQAIAKLVMQNGTVTGSGNLSFNDNTLVLSGNNLITGGTLLPGTNGMSFNVPSGETVVQSTITGANGVRTVFGNGGAPIFSGPNTFSGGLDIADATTVRAGADNPFGTGVITNRNAAIITSDGATARTITNAISLGAGDVNGRMIVGDSTHTGAMTFSGPVTINRTSTTQGIENEVPATFSGVISDGVGTTFGKTGPVSPAPPLYLTAANTFSGGFRVSNARGQVFVGNDAALGTGPVTLENATGIAAMGTTPHTIANTITNLGVGVELGDVTENGKLTFSGSWVMDSGTVTMNCNSDVAFTGSLGDTSGTTSLTKSQAGKLTIGASVSTSYGGATTVNAGTLEVLGTVNGTGVTVGGAGLLSGTGTVTPNVTVTGANSKIRGGTNPIGTLGVGGNLTLSGGGVVVAVNTSGSPSNSVVSVTGSITNTAASTVQVTNEGPALVAGQKYYPFGGKTVANGAGMVIAGGIDAGQGWQNNLEIDGSIEVVGVTAPTLGWQVTGPGVLEFTFPAGYKLIYQTNSLSVGLSTNWQDYPGGGTSPVSVTNNTAFPTTFFGLGQ